ncbi:hypothetical protein AKO1_015816 [Acrasis kona]|uniref:Cytochrome b5 heme-binding domain-containing protein n=1 Tax=Acrasis kona TaxID=1008807 RepID=A0AAW2ZIF7_9EUKA
MSLKEFELSEVEAHDENADRQWFIIDGKVIDFTEYKHLHPGSEDILLELAGGDASESFENVGHSNEAKETLKDLVIGTVKGGPKKVVPEPAKPAPKTESAQESSGMSSIIKFVVVPVLLFIGVYFFTNFVKQQ